MLTYILVYSLGMGLLFGGVAWVQFTDSSMSRSDKAVVVCIAIGAGMALGAFGAFLRATEIHMFGGFR